MKKYFQQLLGFFAVTVLKRYRPKIVAVTGSVGKTSTVRAVAAVLDRSFHVRRSPKNFNNEIGVPLTVLGEDRTGGRSPFVWLGILLRGFALGFGKERSYPEILVLEMGADHPGDLAYLTSLAPPQVSVVTAVSEAHTEFLGGLEDVAREKGQLVRALDADGTAVLNGDDDLVRAMGETAPGAVLTYGFGEKNDVRAEDIRVESAMGTFFTRFDLRMDGSSCEVTLSGSVGEGNVYAALAAAAVARSLGVDHELIPYGLGAYQPAAGRLRVLAGIKGVTLIDDTYNASPRAGEMALRLLGGLEPEAEGKRIAVLGDMLELGPVTEEKHRLLGRLAADLGIDLLIGVGPNATYLCHEAERAGMPEERVFHLHSAEEAGHFLQGRLDKGDIALIKGSQGMRMERVVKELMAEPERADELLVRQGKSWA